MSHTCFLQLFAFVLSQTSFFPHVLILSVFPTPIIIQVSPCLGLPRPTCLLNVCLNSWSCGGKKWAPNERPYFAYYYLFLSAPCVLWVQLYQTVMPDLSTATHVFGQMLIQPPLFFRSYSVSLSPPLGRSQLTSINTCISHTFLQF